MIPGYPGTDVRVCCRDMTPISNHASPISIGKSFTKSHKRGRSSIDKRDVSKPFPILAYDERELFDAMASGHLEARERRVPKAAEKKVKIIAPKLIEPSPQPKLKVSTDPTSRSWYTSAKVEPPSKGAPQRSASGAVPRSARSKVDVGRANSTKEINNHGPTSLVKSAEDTLRPTVWLISKPLPDLPVIDSVSSRWSASTGSNYSCSDRLSLPFLDKFPAPPNDSSNTARPDDWENSNSFSTPPVLMSYQNTSYSPVTTILATVAPGPPALKPLMLKTVPKPKVATVVHQNPHTSSSFSQVQDSIVIQRSRAHPKVLTKDNIHTSSIRTAGPASRGRSSSFGSSNRRNPPGQIVNIEALVWPHLLQTPEELERIERARQERYRQYDLEQEKKRELEQFGRDFGLNPWYKGKKSYERDVDSNGFELIIPKKKQRRWL
jgi:hypothetical protein